MTSLHRYLSTWTDFFNNDAHLFPLRNTSAKDAILQSANKYYNSHIDHTKSKQK